MTKVNPLFLAVLGIVVLACTLSACKKEEVDIPTPSSEPYTPPTEEEGVDYFLPGIDLANWKVTLPIGNPTEVEPPAIMAYASNELLQDFMYNDSLDGSLVFYAYPGATTTNTSYSRCELREQMVPGSNSTNWTFAQGGVMEGTLAVPEVSRKPNMEYEKVIIMQIHGRLSNDQRDLIGASDNNAPPVLKIMWHNGRIRVKTKVLKDLNTSATDILRKDSWEDDEGFYFSENVGTDPFSLKVEASEGKMVITLNNGESNTYEGIHMEKWGVFQNYFKAGNYLQSTSADAFARVKYYDLRVNH